MLSSWFIRAGGRESAPHRPRTVRRGRCASARRRQARPPPAARQAPRRQGRALLRRARARAPPRRAPPPALRSARAPAPCAGSQAVSSAPVRLGRLQRERGGDRRAGTHSSGAFSSCRSQASTLARGRSASIASSVICSSRGARSAQVPCGTACMRASQAARPTFRCLRPTVKAAASFSSCQSSRSSVKVSTLATAPRWSRPCVHSPLERQASLVSSVARDANRRALVRWLGCRGRCSAAAAHDLCGVREMQLQCCTVASSRQATERLLP